MKSKLRMRISSIFIAVIMLINLLPTTAFAIEPDWSGYTAISSEADLKNIENDMDGKYYLTQNITLSAVWEPLGLGSEGQYIDQPFSGIAFTGVLDGNGHQISGLNTGNLATYAGVGLFAKNAGTICNLTLSDAYVYGRYWVGGFAGINNGKIENCHLIDSTIAGHEETSASDYNYVGGSQIGGFSGWNQQNGTISRCSVKQSGVFGNRYVGGAVGVNNGTIEQTFVRDCADVGNNVWIGSRYYKNNTVASLALLMHCNHLYYIGSSKNVPYMYTGGLVGSNQNNNGTGIVKNCYVTNTQINSIDAMGELIGVNWSQVENSYSAENGLSYYSYYRNSLITFTPDYVARNFYDGGGSAKGVHYYSPSGNSILGNGTRHVDGSGMKEQSTYLGWDFENIWTLDETAMADNYGYPVFGPTTSPEPETPSIDGFTKERLTSAPTDVILDLEGVTVDYSDPVVIPQDGSVTLLYQLTITGDEGANFVVTDEGATLVGSNCGATQIGNTISGTIPAGGIAALYVTKTFDADDISGGNLTNSASVAAGDDTDLGDGVGSAEESTPAEEEQPPTTPTAPDDDDLSTILGNDIITVECINSNTSHADGTYGLLKGSYVIGSVNGSAQSGYTCDITVQPALYVQEYNETYGDHSLDPASQTRTIQLVWDASENKWTAGTPASVTFTVKHEDVPGAPEGPDSSFDYDLVDIKVSCECTNSPECTHSTQTYDVTDGEYGVSQPTFNSTKDQWEVYVTVSGTQARSYINQAVAVWENPHSGFENVTPPTKLYTLIYNSQYDTWEKDESIEVEFEVACVHQDEEYDLIYDGNAQEGGITANVPTDSTPHYSGQSVELSRQIPTHSNVNGQKVVFRGWSLTDSDKIYAVGETLPATVTEVTFVDGDIQVHAVWGYEDTTNPPNEPSEGELSSLLGNVVEIVCDNTNSTHQATRYNLLSNSYTCAVESMDNGNYRCVVTISPAEYVKQYNLDTGANHTLDPVSQGSKSVILSWNDQNDSWEMPAVVSPENQLPFRYTVTCEDISLTYDANGGVFANNSETFVAHNLQQNTAYSLGSESGYTVPTYGTHTFKGWTTDISADGKIYEENETLPVLATTVEIPAIDTVYAVWVEDTDDDDQGDGAHHPDAGDNDDDDDNDRDDDTEEIIDEEVPLAETPWLNTEDHYAYIVGYSEDGTVRPNANITRAEVATIFFRLLTDSARDQFWMTTNNFSDVLPNDWYNTAVSTMVNMGIIQGYEDGTFRPNANITRAEFATIAARFLASGYEVEDDLFTDIANHWARESINDAAMAGWINGYEDGTFRPDAAITRAEAVTMVNNVLQRKPDADHMLDSMIKWPDNPEGTWYYEAIQEATNSHDYDLFEDAEYETWTALQENRDWAALEKDWANTHLAGGVA